MYQGFLLGIAGQDPRPRNGIEPGKREKTLSRIYAIGGYSLAV
jgi:hypothetical protein